MDIMYRMFKKGSKFPYIMIIAICLIAGMVYLSLSEEMQIVFFVIWFIAFIVAETMRRRAYSRKKK